MTPLDNALARQAEIIALLSTLGTASSISEGGRSKAVDRAGLREELKYLTEELIPQLSGPWVITSTGKGWP